MTNDNVNNYQLSPTPLFSLFIVLAGMFVEIFATVQKMKKAISLMNTKNLLTGMPVLILQ
ncbi:MAG: hypothetical protein DIZ80_04625 [endosymbiont of Galathealinum brachiosum]|uniref:Uncharacterized protein n=1 Tax=endosymbiont of Galathealinum brachiosum TaxID=2200906 RepID=A0A370DKS4_9GAMM|nr:MAG: hypothetical protein DIZ80_04625 [endosymbiont of Galathealinum brachiosum]